MSRAKVRVLKWSRTPRLNVADWTPYVNIALLLCEREHSNVAPLACAEVDGPIEIDLAKLGRRRELEGFGSVSEGSLFLNADGKVTETYEEGNVSLETAEDEGARLWLVRWLLNFQVFGVGLLC
jgi:hypothetical protein